MLDGAPVGVECDDEAAAGGIEAFAGGETVASGAAVEWQIADRLLQRVAARRGALDVEEAVALMRALAAEVHRHRGFATFAEYLERVLGYAPHTARDRVRVAEALARLPAIRAALQVGRLSWSAARELTRVATPDTEQAWLDAAADKTVREVEDAVRGRRPGDVPQTRPAPDARTMVMRFELAPTTSALIAAVRRDLEDRCGHGLSDDDVLTALCRTYLAGTAHVGRGDGAGDGAGAGDGSGDGDGDGSNGGGGSVVEHNVPPHQIAITTCPDCRRAWADAAGRTIEISATEYEQACCDATHVGRVDGETHERVTRSIPPATRRAVLRRDRGRCVVPGCRNSRHVDVHHIVPRAVGGNHAAPLLVTMCSTHHRAVHYGRLWIAGDAIAGLQFSHVDGTPYGQQAAARTPAALDPAAAPSPPAEPEPVAAQALAPPSPVATGGPKPRTDDSTVRSTLIELGFPAAVATGAVTRARAHVGREAALETLMIAALRACRAPC